jgi:multidrug efflux pump subunit AcrA (membrane-fusion protein)
VSQKSKILKTILLGVVLPSIIIALGVSILVGMGVQQPKQVDIGGVDSISKMSKLPVVGVSAIRSFDGFETLDVNVNGTVVPDRLVTLAAEVAGRVKHKSEDFQIGKYIHKGDVLFRLDANDFQLEVDRLAALRETEYVQQKELDQELQALIPMATSFTFGLIASNCLVLLMVPFLYKVYTVLTFTPEQMKGLAPVGHHEDNSTEQGNSMPAAASLVAT